MSKLFEVALGLVPGVGGYLSKTLVSYCGSAERIFSTPKGKLRKIPGIGEVLAENLTSKRDEILKLAENQLEQAIKHNAQILFYTDADYPERLKNLHDAPSLLYYKGTVSLNSAKIIGIVGTRQATEYGKSVVDSIVKELSKHDAIILSGLAYGIDIAAHKAALQNGLPTIGAMASGLDIIYPASHKETSQRMCQQGGLITEYHFGSKPDPSRFPARNRIIAGLSDALIVVEAAEKGGALITAEIANDYNKEVFAIPGNLGSKFSEGCNKLIQNHKAHIYNDIRSFDYIMNWNEELSKPEKNKEEIKIPELEGLEGEEVSVLKTIATNQGIMVDELSWKTNIPLSKLASIILSLEFKGAVKTLPGKKIVCK